MAHGDRAKHTGDKEAKGERKSEFDLEALFDSLEERAREFLAGAEKWIGQGDEILGKAKTWLEEHPVASAFAAKYGRKVTFLPRSGEELRYAATAARKRVKSGAGRAYTVVRENPLEMAVVGVALGAVAWAAMRATRA